MPARCPHSTIKEFLCITETPSCHETANVRGRFLSSNVTDKLPFYATAFCADKHRSTSSSKKYIEVACKGH